MTTDGPEPPWPPASPPPGEQAQPGEQGQTAPARGAAPLQPGAPDGPPWPAGNLVRSPRSRSLSPRGVIMLCGAIALIAALAGGLIGGYMGAKRSSSGAITRQAFNPGPAPPAVTSRPATSTAGIAARILPSVVMIKVNGGTATGSGFVIKGGYIITNNHVVTVDGQVSHTRLQVVFNGGLRAPAELVGTDPFSDIAVIQPQGITNLVPVQLGNSDGVVVGDPVIAVGSPLGLAGTVTSGIVSALNRPVQAGDQNGSASQAYIAAIQTDAPINPGNSGGPLVDSQGLDIRSHQPGDRVVVTYRRDASLHTATLILGSASSS